MTELRLRTSQKRILDYQGGWMGISAVPGAGKTFTLSLLAANLIRAGKINIDQEVLIVTLVNSAVENFAGRVSNFVQKGKLLPGFGYRVRTLHGLAHDIVRERPGAVGLANDFGIIDEGETASILRQIAQSWLRANPDQAEALLKPDLDESRAGKVRREELPALIENIATSSIRYAKDLELTPEQLRRRLDDLPVAMPLAQMGWALYADYQRALNYRGAVDFDDLIRLALLALKTDPALVERLRGLWPYILEDEAQDSSRLQEQILEILAGPDGNWVRVGDPNQAIFETFTTANPRYLINFRARPGVIKRELPESGRSSTNILRLANHLIEWSNSVGAPPTLTAALNEPYILPTGPDDPQPNPPNLPSAIYLGARKFEPADEIEKVVISIQNWLKIPENQQRTLAVLVPRNTRGSEMVEALQSHGINVVDSLLKTTAATRESAGIVNDIFHCLADPASSPRLSKAYRAWRINAPDETGQKTLTKRVAEQIQSLRRVENYLAPQSENDWLEHSGLAQSDPDAYQQLSRFRELVRRWQGAVLLPVDQLLLTLAQDLFSDPADLAVAHKMAGVLRQRIQDHPDWQLPELSEELNQIALNKRRFVGFSEEDTQFDPDKFKGQVVVATIHKAKGMEWDRVYLLSANNYDFPSGGSGDPYMAERWFIRGELNLEAETLAQLKTALSSGEYDFYEEGTATREARSDYARERLRLLYVGITRARQELSITWNSGRRGESQPCLALHELLASGEA